MTNGEKIKEIFPNGVLTSGGNNSYYWGDDILVSKSWWDAEYKEPTTKNLCDTCGNIINCMMQSGIVRTECSMYRSPKNDLGVDYISRQEVLRLLANSIGKSNTYLQTQVLRMPTATPTRPKGHWIVAKGGSYLGKRNACCSNCKDFYTNDWAYMNYCSNCSADMREVKE